MIRQFELVDKVRAYNPATDEDLLNRAYVFGVKAHGQQVRASGEPYFNHPVEVAAILTSLRLDDATIVTALLHDTIEDTEVTHHALATAFGDEIAMLVDGVTKLSKLPTASREQVQAENFRKLIMAMARDPRVLLVKLADRLHNMRTIHHLRLEKRERIAEETLDIFAPLAARMGMQAVREELEDLAFAVLRPDARLSVMRRFVHLKQTTGDHVAEDIAALLTEALAEDGVLSRVSGREKKPYSIWRKMQTRDVSFEQLSDIIGFRVILDTVEECYAALGVIHQRFRAVPDRFKDYISGPKSNGYRSLHTTVIGPGGARIEVQIRTEEMHEVAETGVAAHWAYKDGSRSANPFAVDPFRWLKDFRDQIGAGVEGEAAEAILEDAKLEIGFDQVFCFTPRGAVKGLPAGATALDFAYAVHTDVGHTAVGAKINGKPAPLWAELRNGQTIEILQSEGQSPSPVWREFVKTARARSAIRKVLRERERRDAAALGAKITRGAFERAGVSYSDKAMEIAAERLGVESAEALLAEIGAAQITAVQALDAVYPERESKTPRGAPAAPDPNRPHAVLARTPGGEPCDAASDRLEMPIAPCCLPLPGERIVGLREPGVGFRLHAIDCAVLAGFEDAMDRWVDVAWAPEAGEQANHMALLVMQLVNEPGALGEVCTLIGASGANIDNVEITDRKPDVFALRLRLEVRDLKHLAGVITALKAQTIVTDVERTRPGPNAILGLEASGAVAEVARRGEISAS